MGSRSLRRRVKQLIYNLDEDSDGENKDNNTSKKSSESASESDFAEASSSDSESESSDSEEDTNSKAKDRGSKESTENKTLFGQNEKSESESSDEASGAANVDIEEEAGKDGAPKPTNQTDGLVNVSAPTLNNETEGQETLNGAPVPSYNVTSNEIVSQTSINGSVVGNDGVMRIQPQKLSDNAAIWTSCLYTIIASVPCNEIMPCPICKQDFNRRTLMDHFRHIHKGIKNAFRCNQCDQSFDRLKPLDEHVKTAHGSSSTAIPFQCPQCDKAFSTLELLNTHSSKVHNKKAKSKKSVMRKKTKTGRTEKDVEYQRRYKEKWAEKIKERDRQRDRNRQMERHMKTSVGRYLLQNPDPPYKCPECPMDGFTNKMSLFRHFGASHKSHADKPFVCHICGKSYGRVNHLNIHVRTVHENERPFICDQCGASFKRKTHLDLHINTLHDEQKRKEIMEHQKALREAKRLREAKAAFECYFE